MLLYVSNDKTGSVVKAPGKSHTRPLMRKTFVFFKHTQKKYSSSISCTNNELSSQLL